MAPLAALVLLCAVCGVKTCLQCDRTIRNMHEDFIYSAKGITLQEQMDLKDIVEHAYTTYQETSVQLRGVVDPSTLYQVQTEYQSEFKRYWQQHRTQGHFQLDMIKIVEKGRRILERHLKLFVAEGLCPNKCGLLFQSVINCSSCQYGLYTCLSLTPKQNCGVQLLENVEKGMVVLDCFLPWHSLVVGEAEYHYSWKQGATNFSSDEGFEVVVVTEDSKIVLNQLSVSEEGVYRCLLLDRHNTELSRIYFILTVIPLPTSAPRPIPTLPPVPNVDFRPATLTRHTLTITLSLLTVLSIVATLTITVKLSCELMERQREKQSRRESEDEGSMERA